MRVPESKDYGLKPHHKVKTIESQTSIEKLEVMKCKKKKKRSEKSYRKDVRNKKEDNSP